MVKTCNNKSFLRGSKGPRIFILSPDYICEKSQFHKELCLANLVAVLAPPLAKTTPNVDALLPRCTILEQAPQFLGLIAQNTLTGLLMKSLLLPDSTHKVDPQNQKKRLFIERQPILKIRHRQGTVVYQRTFVRITLNLICINRYDMLNLAYRLLILS